MTGIAQAAAAEQITMMVVNGRTGVPMQGQAVYVWFDKVNPSPLQLKTDSNGKIVFQVQQEQESLLIGLVEQDVVDCRFVKKEYSDYGKFSYRLSDVLNSGVIATNHCGSVLSNPQPGQLVIFSRAFTFWENVRHFFQFPA